MIKKLAVLVIEEADGTLTLSAGEKGDIATQARELIRATNDTEAHGIARITAIGEAGVLKQRKWKANVTESVAPAIEGSEDESPDAEAIRAALKEKGVKVPPRISIDNLLNLAVEHGVKV